MTQDRPILGILLMLGFCLVAPMGDAAAKLAGPHVSQAQLVFVRFAIQVLASLEELNIPIERVNTWGGAMAVGHPLGASGLRLMMTLHDRLADDGQNGDLGLVTLCVGGGQGMSILCRYVEF